MDVPALAVATVQARFIMDLKYILKSSILVLARLNLESLRQGFVQKRPVVVSFWLIGLLIAACAGGLPVDAVSEEAPLGFELLGSCCGLAKILKSRACNGLPWSNRS